jgi:hypothetical protein
MLAEETAMFVCREGGDLSGESEVVEEGGEMQYIIIACEYY